MIVRILSEGQWELSDEAVRGHQLPRRRGGQGSRRGDQDQLAAALQALLDRVRSSGTWPMMSFATPT